MSAIEVPPHMLHAPLLTSAWVPSLATLTRSVIPVCRSCTKASSHPLVSPGTRLLAPE